MITTKDVKDYARSSLAGKWSKAICINIAYTFLLILLYSILILLRNMPTLYTILSFIIIAICLPLSYGITFAFMKLKRNQEVKVFDFISLGFNNFIKAWKIYFVCFFKLLIPIFIGVLALTLYIIGITQNDIYSYLIIVSAIVALISMFYSYVVILSLSITINIAYDEPTLTARETVQKSQLLMKGNKGNFFLLSLSFIGWFILCALTFGIASFWVIPYMQMSFVCFYEKIINK